MPVDVRTNMGGMVAGLMSNPFGKLMRGFGAVFAGQTAFAAPKILPDPFGITWYGIPPDNAVFREDPEAYYASACSTTDHSTEWNKHVTLNPETGLMEHQQADTCGILNEAIMSGGTLYDGNLADL